MEAAENPEDALEFMPELSSLEAFAVGGVSKLIATVCCLCFHVYLNFPFKFISV
jgi:hypothetical protein